MLRIISPERARTLHAQKTSAGLLLYRYRGRLEVFLVHPGGAKKDAGAWSLPKGELNDGEHALAAPKRELSEETGFAVDGEFRPLTPLKQRSGKVIHAWAIEGDCDPVHIRSSEFSTEWPPRSGRMQAFSRSGSRAARVGPQRR